MQAESELAHHPGPREYVKVAVVLAAATGAEVGLFYMNLPHALFVLLLLFFAAIKFSLVVLWFMHLRFDNPLFRRVFLLGLSLATAVYLIVLSIFGIFRG
jgi:cytochrome c oxidase subunit 4